MQTGNLPLQPLAGQNQEPPADVSASELVREALLEAKELIRLEVALAQDEAKRELFALKSAAIALGIGAALLLVGLSLLLVSLALAIFPGPIPSLVLGLILVGGAGLAALAGMRLLPKKPLAETVRRLETDIVSVKERVG